MTHWEIGKVTPCGIYVNIKLTVTPVYIGKYCKKPTGQLLENEWKLTWNNEGRESYHVGDPSSHSASEPEEKW